MNCLKDTEKRGCEQQLESMQEQFGALKQFVALMMEEHKALETENHHLRTRLEELLSKELIVRNPNWISIKNLTEEKEVEIPFEEIKKANLLFEFEDTD